MASIRRFMSPLLVLRQFSSHAARPTLQPPMIPGFRTAIEYSSDGKAVVEKVGSGRLRPRSVQAVYLQPLRREAEYGVPSCDLQLRSYSTRSLDFFCDFALRAAYYCKLPAFGPVPLPRITERWTVPRDTFIFKKSQENFERITRRRLIQIRDGNTDSVQLWLAFLQKHAYPGIGMKANIWEFCKLGETMTAMTARPEELEPAWKYMGQARSVGTPQRIEELLRTGRFPHGGS